MQKAQLGDHVRSAARADGSRADVNAPAGFDQGLAKAVEGWVGSHPCSPVIDWSEDAVEGMGVAAMEAWFDAADPMVAIGVLAEPIAAFAGGAGEDHVGDASQFFAVRSEGTIGSQAGKAIVAGSHGEKHVLMSPRVEFELGKRIMVDEDMGRSGAQGVFVVQGSIALAGSLETPEVVFRTAEFLAAVGEGEGGELAGNHREMIFRLRRDEQVNVEGVAPLGAGFEAQLNIWENKETWQPGAPAAFEKEAIAARHEVIGDAERRAWGLRLLDRGEVAVPDGIVVMASVLVRLQRARSVDVGIPPMPR